MRQRAAQILQEIRRRIGRGQRVVNKAGIACGRCVGGDAAKDGRNRDAVAHDQRLDVRNREFGQIPRRGHRWQPGAQGRNHRRVVERQRAELEAELQLRNGSAKLRVLCKTGPEIGQ